MTSGGTSACTLLSNETYTPESALSDIEQVWYDARGVPSTHVNLTNLD